MFVQSRIVAVCSLLGVGLIAAVAQGQAIDPAFSGSYTLTDLGSVAGVPTRYGGLTFKYDDPNTILLGGDANSAAGALYAVSVIRDIDGHIVGFGGSTYFADAAWNDGGVAYHPGDNVLFTSRWPANEMGQLKPGSTATDKVIDLAALGVVQSNASVNFVPSGYPGAGSMKIASWSGGQWYDAVIAPDGFGTYDILSATENVAAQLPGGPEGFTYVPLGSPIFGYNPTMILSEYSAGNVVVYDMDANGDPIVASRQVFVSGLTGAEGAAIDPLTGDFIFSTFEGGDRIIRVTGFAVPGAASALTMLLGGPLMLRRRRS